MAVIQALLSALSRRAGKIVNTLFGWATSLLYGKVPPERQIYLSIMSFASVLWIAVAVGLAFPRAGVFLVSFARVPPSIDDNLIRLIMLGFCLFIPLVTGFLSLFMKDPAERPKTAGGRLRLVLKGYPFTLGLSLSMLLMLLFAPLMKIADTRRRWSSEHIQMVVEPGDYKPLVGEIQEVLRKGGFNTAQKRPGWMLRLPLKIMTLLGGGGVKNLVADQLTVLYSKNLEALLLPFDLQVRAKKDVVMRVRALLARDLTFTRASLTWNKDAQALEKRLVALWREHRADGVSRQSVLERLKAVEKDMEKTALPFEEWEVLFREKLLLEKAVASTKEPLSPVPAKSGHERLRSASPPRLALALATLAMQIREKMNH
jgi:hypothetical protein